MCHHGLVRRFVFECELRDYVVMCPGIIKCDEALMPERVPTPPRARCLHYTDHTHPRKRLEARANSGQQQCDDIILALDRLGSVVDEIKLCGPDVEGCTQKSDQQQQQQQQPTISGDGGNVSLP